MGFFLDVFLVPWAKRCSESSAEVDWSATGRTRPVPWNALSGSQPTTGQCRPHYWATVPAVRSEDEREEGTPVVPQLVTLFAAASVAYKTKDTRTCVLGTLGPYLLWTLPCCIMFLFPSLLLPTSLLIHLHPMQVQVVVLGAVLVEWEGEGLEAEAGALFQMFLLIFSSCWSNKIVRLLNGALLLGGRYTGKLLAYLPQKVFPLRILCQVCQQNSHPTLSHG